MTDIERVQFGLAAKTSSKYIQRHLINGTRTPKPDLIRNLVKASNGYYTNDELTLYFVGRKVNASA